MKRALIIHIIGMWLFTLSSISYAIECEEGYAITGNPSCSDSVRIPSLYGVYQVFEVCLYRGGLTTQAEAEERIGSEMVISEKSFGLGNKLIVNPSYQLMCYYYPRPEGDVDSNRLSNFYGFGMGRRIIEVLEVYDLQETADYPKYSLEIINRSELWDLYDGYIYKMKKVD